MGPPARPPPSSRVRTCPRTSWTLVSVRWTHGRPSQTPRWPLWRTPRRPLTGPRPPRPKTLQGLQLPRQETAPRGNQPRIGVTSVASGAPAHATSAPHSRPPRRRERLLRSRPSKRGGYLGMPQVSNLVLPHLPSTLGLRVPQRPPPPHRCGCVPGHGHPAGRPPGWRR